MRVRGLGIVAASVLTALATVALESEVATACTPPVGHQVYATEEPLLGVIEDTLVVKVRTQYVSFRDLIVWNEQGLGIPGDVDTVGLHLDGWYDRTFLIRFRAYQPLVPDALYTVDFEFDPDGAGQEHETLTFVPASQVYAGAPEMPSVEAIELTARRGRRVSQSCTGGDGECGCTAVGTRHFTVVEATLPHTYDDPYLVWRLVPALDGLEVDTFARWDADGVNRVTVHFPTRAPHYCVVLQMEQLLDGTITESEPMCVDDSGEWDVGGGCAMVPGRARGTQGGGAPAAWIGLIALTLALTSRRSPGGATPPPPELTAPPAAPPASG